MVFCRFDAALQKAREERDVKRRGTFKRANKNRYILSTDVSFMCPDDGWVVRLHRRALLYQSCTYQYMA